MEDGRCKKEEGRWKREEGRWMMDDGRRDINQKCSTQIHIRALHFLTLSITKT
jgi:hypothetical protein